tara:strand:- start:1277 stop:1810 length:534 start_codon:yes stop_codon:yes gene_type:complete
MSKNIKFIVIIFFILIIFLIFLKGLQNPNSYLPNNTLKKFDTNFNAKILYGNKEISLKDVIEKDKISIINIWSSWCLPCKEEHTYLLDLKNTGINIIGINYKDKKNNAKSFLNDLGNPYSVVLIDQDGTKSIELGAIGVPETYLINGKTNKIIKKYFGPLDNIKFKEIIKILENENI